MALEQTIVDAVLADWRTAPINPPLRAALAFLEQLAPMDGQPTADHINELRAAGVSKKGIEDIIYLCYSFNVFTRLADAFDFEPVAPEQMANDAKIMLRFGYGNVSL